MLSHGGQGAGLTAFFALLPELFRAAVILCNSEFRALACSCAMPYWTSWWGGNPRLARFHGAASPPRADRGGDRRGLRVSRGADNRRIKEVFLEKDCLVILALQLMMVDKVDLAIDVLRLNVHAFPDYAYSYVFMAKLFLRRGQFDQAQTVLRDALAVLPDDAEIFEMLIGMQEPPAAVHD